MCRKRVDGRGEKERNSEDIKYISRFAVVTLNAQFSSATVRIPPHHRYLCTILNSFLSFFLLLTTMYHFLFAVSTFNIPLNAFFRFDVRLAVCGAQIERKEREQSVCGGDR